MEEKPKVKSRRTALWIVLAIWCSSSILFVWYATLPKSSEEIAKEEARNRDKYVKVDRRRQEPSAPKTETAICDASVATKVRANLGEMMVAQEFKDQMAYSISAGWWGTIRPRLGELVRAAANADICVAGKARRIDFYGPDGKRVAFADPNQGIRVLAD